MENGIETLGFLIAAVAGLSVLLSFGRQSAIVAYIVVGFVAGLFRHRVAIPGEVTEVFTEFGIIFLLFMAGLELDFDSLRKRWKIVLVAGGGQILITCALGVLLGAVFWGVDRFSMLVFFGLCLTFSSTIIVISHLKNAKEMESYHGQIILGMMVLQDITAVGSLVMLRSLDKGGSLATALGWVGLKMVVLVVALLVLRRGLVPILFKYLAREKELTFLGSLGWVLGVAATCSAFNFSPEIGAFMAGAVLSSLPYRLEIQDKVEPMKDFGVLLFFLSLGYDLHVDRSALGLLVPIACVVALELIGSPIVMLAIGYGERQKSRPYFYIGAIINQVSEFSLILAVLCARSKIFDESITLTITLAAVVTFFLSTVGHQMLDRLFSIFERPLNFMDRRAVYRVPEARNLKEHIVVVKFNELAEALIPIFLNEGRTVLLIDIDPQVCDTLSGKHERLLCLYEDIFDPDTREDANLGEAAMIFSCLIGGQAAEVALLDWLNENNLKIPFIAATDSREDALELYAHGAALVVQTGDLAGEHLVVVVNQCLRENDLLEKRGKGHWERLLRGAEEGGFLRSIRSESL